MITIFGFGYWGWGTNVDKLVKMVDESEAQAGFEPPCGLTFDTGARCGRVGSGECYVVGHDRYIGMRELGNSAIDTQRPDVVKLNNPEAASELLTLALLALTLGPHSQKRGISTIDFPLSYSDLGRRFAAPNFCPSLLLRFLIGR